MTYTVSFTPAATADLEDIFDYIAEKAGKEIARGYVTRIYRYCLGFETFPHRGSSREDLMPGLQIAGFHRRATVALLVRQSEVTIIRIFHKGREIDFTGSGPS